jgi:hypothetical protein
MPCGYPCACHDTLPCDASEDARRAWETEGTELEQRDETSRAWTARLDSPDECEELEMHDDWNPEYGVEVDGKFVPHDPPDTRPLTAQELMLAYARAYWGADHTTGEPPSSVDPEMGVPVYRVGHNSTHQFEMFVMAGDLYVRSCGPEWVEGPVDPNDWSVYDTGYGGYERFVTHTREVKDLNNIGYVGHH